MQDGLCFLSLESQAALLLGHGKGTLGGSWVSDVFLWWACRVPYVLALLREGLGIPEERVRIGSGHEQWTLGAALAEGGRVGVGRPFLELVRCHAPPITPACMHASLHHAHACMHASDWNRSACWQSGQPCLIAVACLACAEGGSGAAPGRLLLACCSSPSVLLTVAWNPLRQGARQAPHCLACC